MSRLALPLFVLLTASLAYGQARKPEITIVLDNTRLMTGPDDPAAANLCEAADARSPAPGVAGDQYLRTRFMAVKEALVGQVRNADRRWCLEDEDGLPMEMCCTQMEGAGCGRWEACHEPNVSREHTGLLRRHRNEIDFDFMWMDGDPADDNADELGRDDNDGAVRNIDGRDVNLGAARKNNADPNQGIQKMRPQAEGAPITGTLYDLAEYFEEAADENINQCRQRIAVLVTYGQEGEFIRGGCPCDEGGRCVDNLCVYPMDLPYRAANEDGDFDAGNGADHPAIRLAGEIGLHARLFIIGYDTPPELRGKLARVTAAAGDGPGDAGTPGFFYVTNPVELRAALDRVVGFSRAGLRTRARPLVLAPGPADREALAERHEGNRFLQWRFTTFSEVPGGDDAGDVATYGRVRAAERGCRGDDDDRRRSVELSAVRYEESLASQANRRVVTELQNARARAQGGNLPADEKDVQVVIGPGGMFTADCHIRPAGCGPADGFLDILTDMVDLAGDGSLKNAGLRTEGRFGDRGLPDGAVAEDAEVGPRQLGEMLTGDLVGISPPALPLADPAYVEFAKEQTEERPTLVAGGARDGQLHIWRAVDGVELLNVVPDVAWGAMGSGGFAADGPLSARIVRECVSLGDGDDDCPIPEDITKENFRVMIAGSSGRAGKGLYRVDVTNIKEDFTDLDEADPALDVQELFPAGDREFVWNLGGGTVAIEQAGQPTRHAKDARLGAATSRPVLTHVLVSEDGNIANGQVRAAVVAGCGNDPDNNDGKCVTIRDARNGKRIAMITDQKMDAPMVGSPAVYSAGGVSPAQRIYIGDKVGRLWRIDMREVDPAEWTAEIAWPPEDADAELLNFPRNANLGPVIDAPVLLRRENGRLVVLYGHGAIDIENEDGVQNRERFVVSFTDTPKIDDDEVSYLAEPNWVLKLNRSEYLTGQVQVRSERAYFTTVHDVQVACAEAQGRIYGVHAFNANVDQDGDIENLVFPDQREGAPLPALELTDGTRALAILLPPGRVAFGLTITSTPSCTQGQGPSTEVVVNLADESKGARGRVNVGGLKVEGVNRGRVAAAALNRRIFADAGLTDLAICLDCDQDGNARKGSSAGDASPFRTVVESWGSTFTN